VSQMRESLRTLPPAKTAPPPPTRKTSGGRPPTPPGRVSPPQRTHHEEAVEEEEEVPAPVTTGPPPLISPPESAALFPPCPQCLLYAAEVSALKDITEKIRQAHLEDVAALRRELYQRDAQLVEAQRHIGHLLEERSRALGPWVVPGPSPGYSLYVPPNPPSSSLPVPSATTEWKPSAEDLRLLSKMLKHYHGGEECEKKEESATPPATMAAVVPVTSECTVAPATTTMGQAQMESTLSALLAEQNLLEKEQQKAMKTRAKTMAEIAARERTDRRLTEIGKEVAHLRRELRLVYQPY